MLRAKARRLSIIHKETFIRVNFSKSFEVPKLDMKVGYSSSTKKGTREAFHVSYKAISFHSSTVIYNIVLYRLEPLCFSFIFRPLMNNLLLAASNTVSKTIYIKERKTNFPLVFSHEKYIN